MGYILRSLRGGGPPKRRQRPLPQQPCLGDCFRHGGPRCYRPQSASIQELHSKIRRKARRHSGATSRTPSPECWCFHDLYTFENELYTQVSSWWLGPSASKAMSARRPLPNLPPGKRGDCLPATAVPSLSKIKSEGKRKRRPIARRPGSLPERKRGMRSSATLRYTPRFRPVVAQA